MFHVQTILKVEKCDQYPSITGITSRSRFDRDEPNNKIMIRLDYHFYCHTSNHQLNYISESPFGIEAHLLQHCNLLQRCTTYAMIQHQTELFILISF